MSFEIAKKYMEEKGYGDRVMVLDDCIATVEMAANAIGTEPERIAKSLTFMVNNEAVMVVCAGDTKVDNKKFKECFQTKAKMLTFDEVHEMIGHDVGGVCPFGVKEGVRVFLDESLKRFDVVYPACGDSNSAARLTIDELEQLSGSEGWIDVTKLPAEAEA